MTSESDVPTEKFKHAGLDCKIVKTSLGHWCGYVKRPESAEPVRWRSELDGEHNEVLDAEVDVWCGITYGPDDEGWVGWDDGHGHNIADHRDEDTDKEAVKAETKELAEQIAGLDSQEAEGDV